MVEVFGCDLYNGFGAGTEASGQAMFRPADHRRALAGEEHLLGSIGKPIWGCDIKLCDPDGNEVPDGEVGEIWSRSESVMSGYLGQPELSAAAVRDGRATQGVLICGTGIGISIAANRHRFIRAALVHDALTARLARQHNDANVLVLGGRMLGVELAKDCLRTFFATPFDGGRHARRVAKMS